MQRVDGTMSGYKEKGFGDRLSSAQTAKKAALERFRAKVSPDNPDLALQRAGVSFAVVTYDYDPGADRIGLQAAEAMGVPPRVVLKTLMAEADGKPVCVVVPSDREVGMKKLAAAFGAKSAQMMRPADAERVTGYHVGGISPLGQKRAVPTAIEEAAMVE